MAERVVLHVGTMKSGTSFVQSVLMANPDALAAQGAVFAGEKFGRQSRAVRRMFRSDRNPGRNSKPWRRLIEEARAFDGDAAVISMEFLSFAHPKKIAELLSPARGLRVEVVLTVRDQFRAIPAQFQTFTRNLGTDDWESYLRHIQAARRSPEAATQAYTTFHRAQDVPTILARWSGARGVSRTSVVTVPPSTAAPDLLWQRFAEAAGLRTEGIRTEGLHANQSIGFASCDYLRRLNTLLADVRPSRYREGMRPTIREVLAPLRDDEGRPELDPASRQWAADLNAAVAAAVSARRCTLVGDLADLPTTPPSTGVSTPAPLQPPPDQVLRCAHAVADYCADGLGRAREAGPADLDEAVALSARRLRRLRGWGPRSPRRA